MGTPTQNSNGSKVVQISLQSHLSISTTEDNGSKTATDFYLIKWNGPAVPTDCEGCTDGTNTVPVYGEALGADPNRLVHRVQIQPMDNNTRMIFQQRTEYTDDTTTPSNPLDKLPAIKWETGADGQEPYFLDNSPGGAKYVVNKAGERFAEFLQRDKGTVRATFTVNIPVTGSHTIAGTSITTNAWNASEAVLYCAGGGVSNQSTPAINSDSFTLDGITFAPYQAKAKSCTCSEVQESNSFKYRTKVWTLEFKSDWRDYVENRGFNQLATIGGNTVLREIVKGVPPVKPDSPWPLASNGTALPNVTDSPATLTFYPYPQLAFSGLGFA